MISKEQIENNLKYYLTKYNASSKNNQGELLVHATAIQAALNGSIRTPRDVRTLLQAIEVFSKKYGFSDPLIGCLQCDRKILTKVNEFPKSIQEHAREVFNLIIMN